jgi:hypothetical protein
MRMEVKAHGFTLGKDLHDTVLHEVGRLAQGLRRPIDHIEVDLFDEHAVAPRGRDKRCRVRIRFEDTISVEQADTEGDFHSSVVEAFTQVLSRPRPLVKSSLLQYS